MRQNSDTLAKKKQLKYKNSYQRLGEITSIAIVDSE